MTLPIYIANRLASLVVEVAVFVAVIQTYTGGGFFSGPNGGL